MLLNAHSKILQWDHCFPKGVCLRIFFIPPEIIGSVSAILPILLKVCYLIVPWNFYEAGKEKSSTYAPGLL